MTKKLSLSNKLIDLFIDEITKSIKKSIKHPKPKSRFKDNQIF